MASKILCINIKGDVVVMTVKKRIAALTLLGLGLTMVVGGASKTVNAVSADVPLTSNAVHNYRTTDNPVLLMKIYNEIITSEKFNKVADKSLAQGNAGILEKYLTQRLEGYKEFGVSDRGLNEVKGCLIFAIFQPIRHQSLINKNTKRHLMSGEVPELKPGMKPVPIPGRGPIGCWPAY